LHWSIVSSLCHKLLNPWVVIKAAMSVVGACTVFEKICTTA